ncbi:MAG: type secretion system family protein [Gammaproteobacteria bacterium]|jgi:type IV pilus assembly protein PilC|nr:type secretion system family protein [Gammaproteobacteria bacterium]
MADKSRKQQLFRWQGVDKNGMKIQGENEALDKQSAIVTLKQTGITVLGIKKKNISTSFRLNKKIRTQDISAFTKELSNLISANIPLTSALAITEKNAYKSLLKNVIHKIRKQVDAGKSLSDTFRSCSPYFDDIFCSLIEAGEHSGTLAMMLKNITQHQEKSIKLKRIIKKALLYPITVLTISLTVTIGLLIFIVPQFAELFQNVGAELPILTQIIMSVSNTMYVNLNLISIIMFFSLIIVKILLLRSEKCASFLDILYLNVPIFGNILKQSILARSFHTLSILLHTGVSLTQALSLTAKISNNRIYEKAFTDIYKKVMAGHAIYASAKDTQRFPETAIQMIAIGEHSGTLDDMLKKLGEYFEERVDDIVYNLGQLLEPAIMIFLCLVVGTVVIAMYLPIFNIGTVI